MRRLWPLALAAALSGCPSPPAGPALTGVSPDRGPSNRPVAVAISGERLGPRLFTDFSRTSGSALEATWSARLGREPLEAVALGEDGLVHAVVPSGLAPGTYDVVVVDPSGLTLTLPAAYRVVAIDSVAVLIASYRIEPVSPQQVAVPFELTVSALDAAGAVVDGYSGSVELSDLTGTAVPPALGLFAHGVWTGPVQVSQAHAADVLTVRDADGRTGASNPFAVAAGPAAALRFSTPPRTAQAGACSAAVTVEAVDDRGTPSPQGAALAVALWGLPPRGLGLFADPGCAAPMAAPEVPAGQAALTFYFRSTQAGALELRAAAAGLPVTVQRETVLPGAAAKLAFVSPPQTLTAGACSGPLVVEVHDAFDNPAPVSADTTVVLGAAPAAGFTFFAAPGCGAAAGQALLPAGQATAAVSMLGTAAGVVDLTASAPGLADATQTVRINPEGFATDVAIVSAAQAVAVGSCSGPLVVQTQDSLGNPVADPGAVTVTLSGLPASALAFFTDALCATPGDTVALGSGQSTGVIYFRGLQPGAVMVQASSPGLLGDQQTETVLPGPPALLAFVSAPRTATAGGCSGDVLVQVQDAAGFAAPVALATSVALAAAPSAGFGLYADAACTAPLAGLGLLPGADTARFYFRGTRAGAVTVDATSPGLAPAQQAETVLAGPPTRLVFTTAAQTVGAGSCSGVSTLELQDAFGNTAATGGARTVSLSAAPATGFTFFSDPGCSTAVTQVSIAAAGSQQSFYFRGLAVGVVAVTGSVAGLTPAQQSETVVAGPPAALAFTTAAQARAAGVCSGVATVEVRDAQGNSSPVAALTAVGLAAAPGAGFTFYSDPGCTLAVTQVTVAGGASAASFYFSGTAASAVSVSAAASGLTSAAQTETITAAAAAALAFTTPPRTVNAGVCSPVLTVQVQDAFGNPAPQAAARAVALSAAPAAGFTFYSNAGCTAAVTQVTVAVGAASAGFYVSGLSAGAVAVTAQSAGVSSGVQAVTVTGSAAPSALAFTTPPRTVLSGQCSAVLTVQAQDSGGTARTVAAATPVALTALPVAGVSFFSDATCATAAGSVVIAAGASAASFYVRGGTSGVVGVTASAAGLNPATQSETVQPGAPDRLAFTTAPQTLAAGACSGVATVQSRDAAGNPAAPAANTAVALSSGSGVTFYSDASCTTAVAQVTLAGGTSSVGFYFRGTVAGGRTLTAQVAGWAAGTQAETITAGSPSVLVYTTPPRSTPAGSCSATVTVQLQDAFGNPVAAASALPVALTTAGVAATLYTGTCGAPTTQVTIAAGQSTASFTVRGTAAGQVTVTASAAGLTSAQQAETVLPGPADRLAFVTPAQALVAGACSAVATVEARDQYGNAAPVGAATTVTLSGAPATGYSTSAVAGCGSTAPSVVMAAGAAQVSFYFRDTLAGAVSAQAAAAGFLTGAQTETITAGPATAFQWDPVPATVTAGVAFGATVRAVDAYGNVDPTSSGTAALTVAPAGTTVACTSSCTNATTTGAFTTGVWTGSLTVGGATGPGRVLTATRGALSGSSASFTLSAVGRTPPLARFTATPMVALVGQSVAFDASSSADLQTPTASLQVSWDFTGAAAGPPPWSAWTTTKTATNSFSVAGNYAVRLAVRDADGDLGYASRVVHVLPAATTNLCTVDTSSTADDGASSCTNRGPDGRLSLVEAVRVSNSRAGVQTIAFASGLTISGSGYLNFTDSADVVGRAGVSIVGLVPDITTPGITVRLYDLTLSSQSPSIDVSGAGTRLELHNVTLDALQHPLTNRATLVVDGSTFSRCERDCLDTDGNTTVRHSLFRSSRRWWSPGAGIAVTACTGAGPHLDVSSTVFADLGTGIEASCAATMLVRSDTFDGNRTGVAYASGSGHVLVDNLFTNQSTAATSCGTATFAQRDYHGLFSNAAAGCVGGDAHLFPADPRYAVPGSWDFRLVSGSPAIDAALDLGLKLTQAGPGNFLGAGPDLGGRETY